MTVPITDPPSKLVRARSHPLRSALFVAVAVLALALVAFARVQDSSPAVAQAADRTDASSSAGTTQDQAGGTGSDPASNVPASDSPFSNDPSSGVPSSGVPTSSVPNNSGSNNSGSTSSDLTTQSDPASSSEDGSADQLGLPELLTPSPTKTPRVVNGRADIPEPAFEIFAKGCEGSSLTATAELDGRFSSLSVGLSVADDGANTHVVAKADDSEIIEGVIKPGEAITLAADLTGVQTLTLQFDSFKNSNETCTSSGYHLYLTDILLNK